MTAVVVSGLYAAVLFLAGVQLQGGIKQGLVYLPSVLAVLVVVFDKWLWKWGMIKKIVPRPRLDGTWKGTLVPAEGSHIPETGNWGPIAAYFIIEQSFWSVNVRMFTGESSSHSRTAILEKAPGADTYTFSYTYENVTHGSSRHIGAGEIHAAGRRPRRLEGQYITDRFTKGDLEVRLVDRGVGHGSYAEVVEHCKDK
ncbi:hypothetical protein [Alloactinosynnema sp. L-07]|uniref:Cap15 family cyclic dinucleotide receptor domain-containing protein n=1 Tax=Alloactinosynnema sp. L-07 TaxID=1653480 RepID=UPI00065EF747|nr:hypothetical protein [Alloactinosynnema sp. L-07]CRK55932.1 hypothetical protein [Alloactinosynnema sp. L-07]